MVCIIWGVLYGVFCILYLPRNLHALLAVILTRVFKTRIGIHARACHLESWDQYIMSVHMRLYVYLYVCLYVSLCVCWCMLVCMFVCMYVCITHFNCFLTGRNDLQDFLKIVMMDKNGYSGYNGYVRSDQTFRRLCNNAPAIKYF